MHEPGHKENLKEVWDEVDHMQGQKFNPKTFFHMHDTNSDGRLGQFHWFIILVLFSCIGCYLFFFSSLRSNFSPLIDLQFF